MTISGSVAGAFERQSTAGAKTGISGYDASSNNITFKGVEDLGNGWKAGFVLNKRFNIATGNTAGTEPNVAREFENSYLFLESATLGTVAMGRHQPVSFSSYDPFGALGTDFTGDADGDNTSRAYANNNAVGDRNDSTVSYTSPTISGFNVILATTVNPDINTGKEYTVGRINFNNGPLALSAAYESNETVGTAVQRKDKQLAGSYDFGIVKAALVWGKVGDAKARTAVHATVPVTSTTKLIGTYRTKAATGDAAFALGTEYSLSKRTTAFAHYGDTGVAADQSAYRIGLRHTF